MGEKEKKEALMQDETEILNSKVSQINLVMSDLENGEDRISLVNVLHNMRKLSRKYLWRMLLFSVMGASISLLVYQLRRPVTQVSSVVTLKYMVENDDEEKEVTDLTAPDGTELDLSQIKSSYVLSNTLSGITISRPITVESLQNNLDIQKLTTKDTRRQQELISEMIQRGANDAYTQAGELELLYQNNFIVRLHNGFTDAENGKTVELSQEELQVLLEQVISSYNEYLCRTYADLQLPGDELSVIDFDSLDILDSLDQLSTGVDNLYDYCDEKTQAMKSYRSWKTGHSLEDLMSSLRMVQDVDINYLRSYVEFESVTNNADTILTKYRYQLRQKGIEIEELEEKIKTTGDILSSYKNDSVLVSSQDNASNLATGTTTEYYNELIVAQAENYKQLAELNTSYEILSNRIVKLEKEGHVEEISQEVMNQVAIVYEDVQMLYQAISEQMLEINQRPLHTSFLDHTAAQGRSENFLKAGSKNMMIGTGAGIVIVFTWWFMSALIPELMKENAAGKKETAK